MRHISIVTVLALAAGACGNSGQENTSSSSGGGSSSSGGASTAAATSQANSGTSRPASSGATVSSRASSTAGSTSLPGNTTSAPGATSTTTNNSSAAGNSSSSNSVNSSSAATATSQAAPSSSTAPGALCEGVTCNGHGTCLSDATRAVCHCDSGYALSISTTNCVPTPTDCMNVNCGPHGTCKYYPIQGGSCECDPGYVAYGQACVLERRLHCRDRNGGLAPRGTIRCNEADTDLEVCHDGDGDGLMEWIFGATCVMGGSCAQNCLGRICPDQPCPVGTVCVPEAHQQPLGVCVPTCDCSNCSNCGPDNGDGRWNDWQEYCGAQPNQSPAVAACNLPCPNAGDGCLPYNPGICWPIEGCFSGPPGP